MNNFAPLEMSVKQGAKLWHISHNTIYDRIKKGLLQLNENWKISPSEMTRVFWSPRPNKKVQWTVQNTHWTEPNEPFWTVQISLIETKLNFEKQRNEDLEKRLNEAKTQLDRKDQQISELLQTIKDLSQSIKRLEPPKSEPKPRKKFLGIF